MKMWTNWKLQSVVAGALSLASAVGCAADVSEQQGETTATTDDAITVSASAFKWQSGDSSKAMTKSAETFCFLTEITGSFLAKSSEVGIADNGLSWVLYGNGPTDILNAHGAGARCIKKTNTDKKVWHWPQQYSDGTPDFRPNALRSASGHVCYLVGLGGAFQSKSDYVRTAINSQGNWVLEGSTTNGSVHADAVCVPTTAANVYPNPISPTTEGVTNTSMVPATDSNADATGPVACGLTRIGGAWGAATLVPSKREAILTEYQLPSPIGGGAGMFRWSLTVSKPGLNLSADTRCFH